MQSLLDLVRATKWCCQCGKQKPIAEFTRSSKQKDGRSGTCRHCRAKLDRKAANRYSQQRSLAKKYKIPFELTLEEFAALVVMPCDYCKGPLAETGSGLDRLDPHGGYLRANVVPCCPVCNHMKSGKLFPDEMKLLGPGVAQIRANREALGRPPLMSPFQRSGHWGKDRRSTGSGRKWIRKTDRNNVQVSGDTRS